MLVFDTETYLIVPGLLAPPLVCGSFILDGDPWLLDSNATAFRVRDACLNGELIVGHNVAYDLAVVCAHDPDLIKPIFLHYRKGLVRDTKVRQQLLDIASGDLKFHEGADGNMVRTQYSLAALAERHLGEYVEKGSGTWRLRYQELDGVPLEQWPPEAREYALNDARVTRDVYLAQGGDILNEIEQTRAAWALHLMSVWGMRTDKASVETLKAELLAKREEARAKLIEAGFYKGVPFNTDDRARGREPDFFVPYKAKNKKGQRPMKYGRDMAVIKARVEAAFTAKGEPVPKTGSGEVSTEKDVLERSGDELLDMLADGGGVDKILDTYVPALEQGTEVPINPGFNVLVSSGRTSSYKPNIQNLPSGRRVGGVRECFAARPGFAYVSNDYDTLELRALAHWCEKTFGWSKMADALRAGRELHLDMAAQILGISYEEALARHERKDKEIKNARNLAKVANFGIPGGMGGESLVEFARKTYGVIMTVERAWELKAQFLASWPEMDLYFRYHAALAGLEFKEAKVTQLYSNRVRGGLGFCDACNTEFQGLAADGGKAALFEVSYECYADESSALYGSRPVAFIHDEILAEVPLDRAHEACERLSVLMVAHMLKYVPTVPVTVSPTLMLRWSKDAKPVYVNKRLVPWTPDLENNSNEAA